MVVDELNLDDEYRLMFDHQIKLLKDQFEPRRINVYQAYTKDEVHGIVADFISKRPEIKSIAFSDSVTLYQLDIYNFIKNKYNGLSINQPLERSESGHYKIFGNQPNGRMTLPYEDWKIKHDLWYDNVRQSLMSDLLIISANAITLDGEIVSIDGLGNRVSGMIFGPRHVLCIVGKNKIVTNVDAAIDRIHNFSAPLNYIRHYNKHYTNHDNLPCVKKGKCYKCSSKDSACMNTVIVRGQIHHHSDRIHLVVVNENLGF